MKIRSAVPETGAKLWKPPYLAMSQIPRSWSQWRSQEFWVRARNVKGL